MPDPAPTPEPENGGKVVLRSPYLLQRALAVVVALAISGASVGGFFIRGWYDRVNSHMDEAALKVREFEIVKVRQDIMLKRQEEMATDIREIRKMAETWRRR